MVIVLTAVTCNYYKLRHYIIDTTSEFESNPKYITFPNTARIEFHYKQTFVPLEDVVGPSIHYVVDKSEEKEEKK